MFDLDSWREIWAVLRANRLRTFLTAFGVFWGIVMLMAMLAFGASMQSGTKRAMHGLATNLLFIWGQRTTEAYEGMQPGRQVKFEVSDIDLMHRIDGVEWVAPRLQLGDYGNNTNVTFDNKTGSYAIMGDYPELSKIVAFQFLEGRFINQRDLDEARKVVVIGEAVKDEIYPPGVDPLGTYIKISGLYFQVIGVVKTLAAGEQGDNDAHTINMPFTTMAKAFHRGEGVHWFALTAKPSIDGTEFERRVRAALAAHHHVSPTDKLAMGSFNLFEVFDKVQGVFVVIAFLSWIVGGMTLIAGAVGVMNIMLITVKERTKEFGVRKALGATPRSVILMVLKESIVLTMIAGLVGVAAGVGLMAIADTVLEHAEKLPFGPPNVGIKTVLEAIGVLGAAGALAGIMPAAHAASIKPVEALRAE
jgi:putative ABC transport system permease protein